MMLISLLVNVMVRLPRNATKPVDAILVLGGSIRREIYVAQLANSDPEIPIIISQGSKEPCISLIFQRENARSSGVWLEKCAQSTFGNFFFSVPLLRRWHVHKVKLVTSLSHLPRAQQLGEILLGAQGIAVEIDPVQEQGIPGNQESSLKTGLDIARSIVWAFFSQLIQPPCFDVTELPKVDMQAWQKEGFACEEQGGLGNRNSGF